MDRVQEKVSLDEFKIFYGIDRQLYTILVKNLMRSPVESLQIMGFWLWIERLGISTVISRLRNIKVHLLINALAEEALAILKLMNNGTVHPSKFVAEIPLTRCLLNKRVDRDFFYTNRAVIIKEVRWLINDVYIPAMSDLIDAACCDFAESSTNAVANSVRLAPPALPSSSALASRPIMPPVPIPSAPYEDQLIAHFSRLAIQGGSVSSPPTRKPRPDTCEYARTMFATFSKGYPVSEREVKAFFAAQFGNCIDVLYMQEVPANHQPLYARIVFADPSYLQVILNGRAKAKFTINGKHVWMRQFVPRNGRHMPNSAHDYY